MDFSGKSLVSIRDLSKDEILFFLDKAEDFERLQISNVLENRVVACLFFEPSTRTRLSFESSVVQLGGGIIGFADSLSSSIKKGESLKDTIRTVSKYADLIVIRHGLDGSARLASEVAEVPVVNAGDGTNQHPTQTLLDLYSIRKTQGTLDGLCVVFVGDLKYGRTVHSLVIALSLFNCRFVFVSPGMLRMPKEIIKELEEKGIEYEEHEDLEEIIGKADIVYMTRIQKERFSESIEYEKVKSCYVLDEETVERGKDNMKVLHPLPRVNEIDEEVDINEKAYYFEQVKNGIYVRKAILSLIMEAGGRKK